MCRDRGGVLGLAILSLAVAMAGAANAPPKFILDGGQNSPGGDVVVRLKEGPETPPGTKILHLRGHDPDGDRMRFGFRGSAPGLIRIEGGQNGEASVFLERELDAEAETEHQILLTLTDGKLGAGKFITQSLILLVEDVNDNAPVFPSCKKEFAVTVPENSPRGFRFGGPPVVDLDSGDRLLFWISNTRQFDVEPETGVLTTRAVFDYEASVAHRLIVHANDSAGHETSCNVLVLVGSVDEYAPTFDQTNSSSPSPGSPRAPRATSSGRSAPGTATAGPTASSPSSSRSRVTTLPSTPSAASSP